jgi:hypothetical protein
MLNITTAPRTFDATATATMANWISSRVHLGFAMSFTKADESGNEMALVYAPSGEVPFATVSVSREGFVIERDGSWGGGWMETVGDIEGAMRVVTALAMEEPPE